MRETILDECEAVPNAGAWTTKESEHVAPKPLGWTKLHQEWTPIVQVCSNIRKHIEAQKLRTHLNSWASSPQIDLSRLSAKIGMSKGSPFLILYKPPSMNAHRHQMKTSLPYFMMNHPFAVSERNCQWKNVILHRYSACHRHGRVKAKCLANNSIKVWKSVELIHSWVVI